MLMLMMGMMLISNDDDDNSNDGDDLDTVDPGGEGERLEQRGGGEGLHLDRGKIPN